MQQAAAWDDLIERLAAFQRRISKSTATNVSASNLRMEAKGLVQLYFRRVRGELEALGLHDFGPVDQQFQALLARANRVSRRSTYIGLLKDLRSLLEATEARREVAIGTNASRGRGQLPLISDSESGIIETLNNLVPSAALSYRQALADLGASGRLSFRGTGAELREALREILDHLAPDDAVMASPGFKLKPEQARPTMRQKVRFILKSRDRSKSAIGPAETAAELVEELTASLVRSVYDRASLSTHVAPSSGEVKRVKAYVDTILVDLLEI